MSPASRGRKRRRASVRTPALAVTAGATTAVLIAAELARVWRRGRAPAPKSRRELLQGGQIAARETAEVLRAGYRAGAANETAALNLFLSFGATFAVARAVTHSIRSGAGPLRNLEVGRHHIHHFVPGILLVLAAGGTSVVMRHEHLDQWLAAPFGAGAALIVDETALLIELADVYWSERGVLSIDAGLGAVSALACLALGVRVVRRGEAAILSGAPGPDQSM